MIRDYYDFLNCTIKSQRGPQNLMRLCYFNEKCEKILTKIDNSAKWPLAQCFP
jgi:hypothetical protein